jgi:alkanesulfonate monooxygenase SsuD/methylene tetrahydromethanopterin reductase-like flavin-dependent oxidoreductase (luciferase family)
MALELGVYSFGNTPRTSDGGHGPTAQAVRDVLEAVRLAEEVGLGFFGFGEHHTRGMPLSSPTSLVTAAAASTQRVRLGTTVTVLSTDEPIRVFQQLATAAAIAPGRIEAVAGRGSSAITFPIFDLDEGDYDLLYGSKLELLLALNRHDRVTWDGPHRRRPLQDVLIVPRPEQPLRIWLGSGGSPASVVRAVDWASRCSSGSSVARRSAGPSTATATVRRGSRWAIPSRRPTSLSRCTASSGRRPAVRRLTTSTSSFA